MNTNDIGRTEMTAVNSMCCACCGDHFPENYMCTAPDGACMCEDCFSFEFLPCGDCGETVHRESVFYTYNTGYYCCRECAEESGEWVVCHCCGGLTHCDDLEADEAKLCDYCCASFGNA